MTVHQNPVPRASSSPLVPIGASLFGIAALWYLVCEAVAAIGFPAYSYATNWVSDLGVPEPSVFQGREINSRLANVMNTGFVGEGALVAIGALLIFWESARARRRAAFLALGLMHGVGIALVGMVHGSQANQEAGLTVFHFGGASFAIIGGNVLLIVAGSTTLRDRLSFWMRRVCIVLGILGLVSLALLVITAVGGWEFAPVWERGSVYTIMAGNLLLAGNEVARRRGGEAPET